MTTASLAIIVLWITKHRSGVVLNMTTAEWISRVHQAGSVVITVARHKTGDKEPATVVVEQETEELLAR